ncbi:hydroxymethylglutaryl-CoA lyase [Alicyclobacillus ferrooxydans]|uniref:Hydroxymethylglutaryl-CoA lyase n=1 Tax=Alicyclobacillus ferrooxydans TaxID=471514 RepID=A0A0P9EU26_9BACL|nr:hydroxymethylglutaryl-CoA lyase [Alicyclobacillus ferrooxydans]KPV42431.1 hydroxymethylglutaryl-CoA lyase [Alicyclobacillus ferrooxydans]
MIDITEVGPRDGLQNEERILSVEERIDIITNLVKAGMKSIEAVSFVNPKIVPQMAGAEEVVRQLPRIDGVRYAGLVLSEKGMKRALDCELDELNVVLAASSTFNYKNSRRTREEALRELTPLIKEGKKSGFVVNAVIGTAFGCPFEGHILFADILQLAKQFLDSGADKLTLADTTGLANPAQVMSSVKEFKTSFPTVDLGLHFHNTRGLALANAHAGYLAGVRRFDSSIGGIGGCPFAPLSVGNVSTEDMVHMFEQMGEEVPVKTADLFPTTDLVQKLLGHPMYSYVRKAGVAYS